MDNERSRFEDYYRREVKQEEEEVKEEEEKIRAPRTYVDSAEGKKDRKKVMTNMRRENEGGRDRYKDKAN